MKNRVFDIGYRGKNNKGLEYVVIEIVDRNTRVIEFIQSKYTTKISVPCIYRGTIKDHSIPDKYDIGNIFLNNDNLEFKIIEKIDYDRRKIQFLKTKSIRTVKIKEISNGSILDYEYPSTCDIGKLGTNHTKYKKMKGYDNLYSRWSKMLHRCYNPNDICYINYGAKGVRVCEEWLTLSNYIEDIMKKKNYNEMINDPKSWHIDKDILGEGSKIYSNETTCIISIRDNVIERNNRNNLPKKNGTKIIKHKNGDIYKYYGSIINASVTEKVHKNSIRMRVNKQIITPDKDGFRWCKVKNTPIYFIFAGFSGTGKDSIVNAINKKLNIPIIVSHTTRPPRNESEIKNNAYHFVDSKFFIEEKYNWIESRQYKVWNNDTWFYGIHKSELLDKPHAMVILDPNGIEEFQNHVGKENTVIFLIDTKLGVLKNRLIGRNDNKEEINRRLEDDERRFKNFKETFDYIKIDNNGYLEYPIEIISKHIVDKIKYISEDCI